MLETWLRTVFGLRHEPCGDRRRWCGPARSGRGPRARARSAPGRRLGRRSARRRSSSISRRAIAGPKIASPRRDRADGAHDLVLVGALEQVAARAGAHGGEDRVVVLEHRQHQHADVRAGRDDRAGGLDAVRARASAGPSRPRRAASSRASGDRLGAVGGLADDLDVAARVEQRAQPVAEDRVVVGDQDADGHRVAHGVSERAAAARARRVPPPGRGSTAQRAAELGGALAHRGQADAGAACRGRARGRRRRPPRLSAAVRARAATRAAAGRRRAGRRW